MISSLRIFARTLATLLLFCASLVSAQSQIEKTLLERIHNSQAQLSEDQEKISQQRLELGKKLDKQQNTIATLRDRAEAAQRAKDERLIGLEELKQRLDKWRNQSNYQAHAIRSYIEGVGLTGKDADSEADIASLDLALSRLDGHLRPAWSEREIVGSSGKIAMLDVLRIGPVEMALNPEDSAGGPVIRDLPGEARLAPVLSSSQIADLSALKEVGQGMLAFDPTLGNALQIHNQTDGIFAHLQKGGVWALPILFFGFISFVIALTKGTQLLRLPKIQPELASKLEKWLNSGSSTDTAKIKTALGQTEGPQRKLLKVAIDTPVSAQRDELLVASLMDYKHKLERFMGVVATSAAISPLLGLLGTVSGMIATFKMMTIFGSGDASTVSGGISEALVTTELGLIVAIPSLIVSALLTRKIKSYTHKLETFAIRLSKLEFGKRSAAE